MESLLPSHLSWVVLGDREEIHVTGISHLQRMRTSWTHLERIFFLNLKQILDIIDIVEAMGKFYMEKMAEIVNMTCMNNIIHITYMLEMTLTRGFRYFGRRSMLWFRYMALNLP